MKKHLLFLFLIPVLMFANTDRALYIKKYANEKKSALVIGNSNYTHFSKLKNSINDARDVKEVLISQGFEVVYLENGSLKEMEKMVRKFSRSLKESGVGFFYYAGHGLEVDGNNYLIPIDADIPEKDEVKYESVAMNMIIDKMESAKNRLNIVVLDACRNDPFSRSGGGGLAQINNAKGMYISYATAPGEVASDGSDENGLFTKHLIKNMQTPNLKLNEVFAKTRKDVYDESDGRQLPWTSSSVIGDFYFKVDKNIIYQQTSQTVSEEEKQFWETVVKKDNKEFYELYLKEFPGGFYFLKARKALHKLKQKKLLSIVNNNKIRTVILPFRINYKGIHYCSHHATAVMEDVFKDKRFERYVDYCDKDVSQINFPPINEDYSLWESKGFFSREEPHLANILMNTKPLNADIALAVDGDGKHDFITYLKAYIIDLKTNKIYSKESEGVITVKDVPKIIKRLFEQYLIDKKIANKEIENGN